MIIDRQKHRQFIADELKAQTDEFKVKLSSSAVDLLLEKNEVFVAIFVNFTKRGEMVLKLPASRPLPRKNDFLPHCLKSPLLSSNSQITHMLYNRTSLCILRRKISCRLHIQRHFPVM